MSVPNQEQREEEVLDALIVAALCQTPPLPASPGEVAGLEDCLDDEDRRVLEVRGADVVARVLRQCRREEGAGQPARPETPCWLPGTVAFAMNRGGDEATLTDKAREEMERRVRQHQEQKPSEKADGREGD